MKKLFLMFSICFMITCVMVPQVFATSDFESNDDYLSQTEDGNSLYNINSHGQYALSAKDSIAMSIEWQGSGSYLVLLTKQDYSVEEISELAQSGLLPIGDLKNGVNKELAEKFNGIQLILSVSSNNTLNQTIFVSDTATYNLYTIAEADCTEVSGTITAATKQISLACDLK